MVRIILVILLLASPAWAETFGIKTLGASTGGMATWGNNYVARGHRYSADYYVVGSNDMFTEVWLYGDSLTAPCSLFAGIYGAELLTGDSLRPDDRLGLCDTLYPVPNNLRWLRLNAANGGADIELTENDTVGVAWSIDEDVGSRYDADLRSSCVENRASDALPSNLTPTVYHNYRWSVFGCINQEGAGAIDQGHVPGRSYAAANWTTPGNITGNEGLADLDNACASYDNTAQDILVAIDFDHSLPTSPAPTIDSITVVVQGNCESTAGAREMFNVSLAKDSSTAIQWWAQGFTQTGTCGGSEDNISFTMRADTLGTWSGAGINDSLYILLQDFDTQASILYFDGLSTTVYFTPGGVATAAQVINVGGG